MAHSITLDLSPRAYAELEKRAAHAGVTPAGLAAEALEGQFREPDGALDVAGGFEQFIGSVDLGRPTGADNASIDADLAREYGRGL